MLEGKYYSAIDTVFPFLAAFIDRVTGYIANLVFIRVHAQRTKILNHLQYESIVLGNSSASGFSLIHHWK